MDINDIRTVLTLAGFVGFIGIVMWAYGRGAKSEFEVAQALPFADDAEPAAREVER
jgi:cytochrome c oxidase cbb3-type subunit IV